jgi:pimeloyl-ACP methyl ester carboxylesterase
MFSKQSSLSRQRRRKTLRALSIVILTGVSGIVALLLVATLVFGLRAFTPPVLSDAGEELPGSIATLEAIELGGLEQWILIRGADTSNPLLLWLHGGPGATQMPLAHHLDAALEQHFVVVHWDQRGAGKSNHRGFDESTMRLDRYLDDARVLIEHLRARFSQDRIVLLGHSWGTQLGIELVASHPDLFSAYIGVSQTVNHDRATVLAHDWLLDRIDPQEAREDLQALHEVSIPARLHSDYRKLASLVDAYGGSFDAAMASLAWIALQAPEYSLVDYWRLLRGMSRGGGPMHENGRMAGYDHIAKFPAVSVPVYFFSGAWDYNTPLSLVREYFDVLDAPHKELVIFENAAHLPFLAEPDRFVQEVIRVAAERRRISCSS